MKTLRAAVMLALFVTPFIRRLIRLVKVEPGQILIVRHRHDITDLRGPGFTFLWRWEIGELFFTSRSVHLRDKATKVSLAEFTGYDIPEPVTVLMRAKGITVDLVLSLTGNMRKDIQSIEAYLKMGLDRLVSNAFQRFCAGRTLEQLINTTSASEFITRELQNNGLGIQILGVCIDNIEIV